MRLHFAYYLSTMLQNRITDKFIRWIIWYIEVWNTAWKSTNIFIIYLLSFEIVLNYYNLMCKMLNWQILLLFVLFYLNINFSFIWHISVVKERCTKHENRRIAIRFSVETLNYKSQVIMHSERTNLIVEIKYYTFNSSGRYSSSTQIAHEPPFRYLTTTLKVFMRAFCCAWQRTALSVRLHGWMPLLSFSGLSPTWHSSMKSRR